MHFDMNQCISVIERCTCIDANPSESAPESADPASKSDLCTFITILDIDRCTFISNDAPGRLIDTHASMQTGVDPHLVVVVVLLIVVLVVVSTTSRSTAIDLFAS